MLSNGVASKTTLWYELAMTIILTPEQQAWLEAQVAAGTIPSVDEAIKAAIADLITLADDDLAWAKPYVDDARASIAKGDVVDGNTFLASLRERAARLKSV